MISVFLPCYCFIFTHLSNVLVTQRYIGVTLCGQPMKQTDNCPKFARCLYSLSSSRNDEESMSDIRVDHLLTQLSNVFYTQRFINESMSVKTVNHSEKLLTSKKNCFVSLRGRTLILCGKHYTVEYAIFRQISRDIISIFLIIFLLSRCLHYRIFRNSRNGGGR